MQSLDAAGEIARVRLDHADRRVRICEGRIELESPICGDFRCCASFSRRCHSPDRAEDLTVGDRRPGQRVVRIVIERALCMAKCRLHDLWRSGEVRVAALQKLEMRLGVHLGAIRQLRSLARRELDRDRARNSLCELALQIEHVHEIAIVAVCPERLIGPRRNQLDAHAHPAAHEQGRAFQHRVDIQLARDIGERLRGILVCHHRRPRDDAQRLDAREIGNDRLGHPIGKVFLRRIPRDIAERKHGNRPDHVARG